MNRLEGLFRGPVRDGYKAAVLYLTAGFPSLEATVSLVPRLAAEGIDVIELGVPFSDPVADGVTIQRASAAALGRGVTLAAVLEAAALIRKSTPVPLVLMGYYNPILAFGPARFAAACARAGVDGLIVPDLPPEEAAPLRGPARRCGVSLVFLLAPNSPPERIRLVGRFSSPFVYYVSVAGVTGARRHLAAGVGDRVAAIRRLTGKPVCLGFGVSRPAQAARVAGQADGVIVGSAFLGELEKSAAPDFVAARRFAGRFAAAVHGRSSRRAGA